MLQNHIRYAEFNRSGKRFAAGLASPFAAEGVCYAEPNLRYCGFAVGDKVL